MTFTQLQKEVDRLPAHDQDVLAAYLTLIRKSRDPQWQRTLTERLSAKGADRGVELGEFKSQD